MASFSYITSNLPAANLTSVTMAQDKKEMKDFKELQGFYN